MSANYQNLESQMLELIFEVSQLSKPRFSDFGTCVASALIYIVHIHSNDTQNI